jgi:hypothetical protein
MTEEAKRAQNEYKKAWRAANPDKMREQAARYREKHKDQIREYTREWRKRNPERVAATAARYWEKKAKTLAAQPESAQDQPRDL